MKIKLLFLTILVLSSCAADPVNVSACVVGKPDGFWMGLWHGIIAPLTFIISLFTNDVEMWSVNNNGGWYSFGFVLGAGILFGGSSRSTS